MLSFTNRLIINCSYLIIVNSLINIESLIDDTSLLNYYCLLRKPLAKIRVDYFINGENFEGIDFFKNHDLTNLINQLELGNIISHSRKRGSAFHDSLREECIAHVLIKLVFVNPHAFMGDIIFVIEISR